MLKKAYLEITNVCNLSCSFCHGTSRKPHFLSVEEFEILTEKLDRIQIIYIFILWESRSSIRSCLRSFRSRSRRASV